MSLLSLRIGRDKATLDPVPADLDATPSPLAAAEAAAAPEDPGDDMPAPGHDRPGEDEGEGEGREAAAGAAGGDVSAASAAAAAAGNDVSAARAAAAAAAAEIATYCAANGAAGMAPALIREGADMDTVRARVGATQQIRAMVADAAAVSAAISADLAQTMIDGGLSVEAARTRLFDLMVGGQSAEIRPAVTADTGGSEAAAAGWGRVVDKINARKAG